MKEYDYRDISRRYGFAEELRVPLVDGFYPQWNYTVAVAVSWHEGPCERATPWCTLMPTDDEIRMIASFIQEYRNHWYREGAGRELDRRPYDIDGVANGIVFGKMAELPENGKYAPRPEHWTYHKRSWRYGPLAIQMVGDRPMTLLELMDHERTISSDDGPMPRWIEWKAAHPEIFGGGES